MNITAKAVEAALEAFWDNEDEPIMTGMKRALEAAAPHILAGAKADAYDEGFEVAGDRFPAFNPYRPTP